MEPKHGDRGARGRRGSGNKANAEEEDHGFNFEEERGRRTHPKSDQEWSVISKGKDCFIFVNRCDCWKGN